MIDYPPEVWGPHFWFFIHTISFFYPDFPNDTIKKKHYEFIHNLPFFIPHNESSTFFTNLLNKYPLKPFLDSKLHFMQWTHFIHNKVNLHLNKSQLSFNDFYGHYYSKFHYKHNKYIIRKKYKFIVFISFFVFLISMSIYLK
uniref:thiol oxidase n=1 Tax=viral metagenome TaxID=1070528 RepID=A0A6C0H548_9ZZZZ